MRNHGDLGMPYIHTIPPSTYCRNLSLSYADATKGNKMWWDVLSNIYEYQQNEAAHEYGELNKLSTVT